jgi:hypothetical protein
VRACHASTLPYLDDGVHQGLAEAVGRRHHHMQLRLLYRETAGLGQRIQQIKRLLTLLQEQKYSS